MATLERQKRIFSRERDRRVIKRGWKRLINASKLSDVRFSVGPEKTIYHGIGALFAMHCTKFDQWIYSANHEEHKSDKTTTHEEKQEDDDGLDALDDEDNEANAVSLDEHIIALQHISCKAFEFIQSYFYQNPKKLSVANLVDVLLAAKEFELDNIQQICLECIQTLKQASDHTVYFLQIVNELYYKGETKMVRDMLENTLYVLVHFVFISLQPTAGPVKPIYYAVTMEQAQTIGDLKRYVALAFVTDSVGKGAQDIIVCTASNNTCIQIHQDDTNISKILNECIVLYYSPSISLEEDIKTDVQTANDQKQPGMQELHEFILEVQNRSGADKKSAVSFPFVIKLSSKSPKIPKKLLEDRLAQIVGIMLNEEGFLNIKDGNFPFKVSYGDTVNDTELSVNLKELPLSENGVGLITLAWNDDGVQQIEPIWSEDICVSNKTQRSTTPMSCTYLPSDLLGRVKKIYTDLSSQTLAEDDIPRWSIKQEIKRIQQNLKANLDNKRYADVQFEIGKSGGMLRTFYGISALFATQSTVFEAQFYGRMFESRADNSGNIRLCRIDDIEPGTFEFLREYFYNLDPKMSNNNAVEIVYASTKYLLPALQYPCSKFITSLYSTSKKGKKFDIYTLLPMMVQLYNIGFHDMSISLLNKSIHLYHDAQQAMQHTEFLSLPSHILKLLVASDEFGANEYVIYRKIVQWAQHNQTKLQQQESDGNNNDDNTDDEKTEKPLSPMHEKMNEFKYMIRWPLIDRKHFEEDECGQYCLNKQESQHIRQLLSNTEPETHLMGSPSYPFKYYYRDCNKNMDDAQCISYKYYNQIENREQMHIMQFVYVDLDFNHPERNRELKTPTFYGCVVQKSWTVDDFRRYCCKRFQVADNDYENIFVCLIVEGKIFHVYHVQDAITELDTSKYLICVYYVPLVTVRAIKVTMHDSDDDEDENEHDTQTDEALYPYSSTIDGLSYRWNYADEIRKIQEQREQSEAETEGKKDEDQVDEAKEKKKYKPKKKKQHLLSIIHVDPEHDENLKPLCGIPLLLNLYAESKVDLFSIQQHFVSKIGQILMDDQLYASICSATGDVAQRLDDEHMKQHFNIVVRRQFIYYSSLDEGSVLKLEKADTQNLLCLKFEHDQIHNFKKAFTHSVKYCRKHISSPPTSMGWKLTDNYTEKKMIRYKRTKQAMKLSAKPKSTEQAKTEQ